MLSLETITQTLAKNILNIRKSKNLTQNQLAAKLNVSRASIGSYEECRALPNILVLIKLSELSGHGIKTLVTVDISTLNKSEEAVSYE